MRKFIIIFILLIPTITSAEWTEDKIARQVAFSTVLVNDWNQTLVIAETPWRRETNKLLGRRPHRDNVNIYFAGCLIGHGFITYILPENYAKFWQNVWIGIESKTIENNVKIGHKIKSDIAYNFKHTIFF